MTVEEYNSAVDRYADNLYRFIIKNCRNESLAQDVIQESFEKLWTKRESVEGAKAKSYLFTTAYHTMLDMIKKEDREGEMDHKSDQSHAHNEQYSDVGEVLERALTMIPEIQRTVVLLRDYEGYSYEEIGDITGLSGSQVKVYIYRARVTLKNYLVKMDNVI
jgi:RNA polymerase sigma-70 factor (ECF subfamily)